MFTTSQGTGILSGDVYFSLAQTSRHSEHMHSQDLQHAGINRSMVTEHRNKCLKPEPLRLFYNQNTSIIITILKKQSMR